MFEIHLADFEGNHYQHSADYMWFWIVSCSVARTKGSLQRSPTAIQPFTPQLIYWTAVSLCIATPFRAYCTRSRNCYRSSLLTKLPDPVFKSLRDLRLSVRPPTRRKFRAGKSICFTPCVDYERSGQLIRTVGGPSRPSLRQATKRVGDHIRAPFINFQTWFRLIASLLPLLIQHRAVWASVL